LRLYKTKKTQRIASLQNEKDATYCVSTKRKRRNVLRLYKTKKTQRIASLNDYNLKESAQAPQTLAKL